MGTPVVRHAPFATQPIVPSASTQHYKMSKVPRHLCDTLVILGQVPHPYERPPNAPGSALRAPPSHPSLVGLINLPLRVQRSFVRWLSRAIRQHENSIKIERIVFNQV